MAASSPSAARTRSYSRGVRGVPSLSLDVLKLSGMTWGRAYHNGSM